MLTLGCLQVVIYTVYEALNSFTVAQMLSAFEYSILVSHSPIPHPIAELPHLMLQETKLEN